MKRYAHWCVILSLALWRLAPPAAGKQASARHTSNKPTPGHAIVVGSYLLGGSAGAKWLDDKTMARRLHGGEKYMLYNLDGWLGQSTGTKPRSFEAPCPDTLQVRLEPVAGKLKIDNSIIAVSGNGNPLPRHAQRIRLTNSFYRDRIAGILKQHGIAKPDVRITQAFRIDLDGDGEDETVICATKHAGYGNPGSISSNSRAGEYSMIFLRKVVQGKTCTIMINEEYHPHAETFNAPSIFSILGILDLNGDGQLELVLESRYYEGDSVGVYTVRGAKVSMVLGAGCGA